MGTYIRFVFFYGNIHKKNGYTGLRLDEQLGRRRFVTDTTVDKMASQAQRSSLSFVLNEQPFFYSCSVEISNIQTRKFCFGVSMIEKGMS